MIPRSILKGFAKTKRAYRKGTLGTGIWNSIKPNGLDYAIAGATVAYGLNDSSEDRKEGFISKAGNAVVDGAVGLGMGMALTGGFKAGKGLYGLGKMALGKLKNAGVAPKIPTSAGSQEYFG